LSQSDELCLGPCCNEGGLFLGRTPLLEREDNQFIVRDQGEIERVMSAGYGCDVALESRMGGLRAVAKALNAGDLCRATIAAVMLQLPDLPSYAARQKLETEDWLVKAQRAAWAKIAPPFDSEKHPRWPRGQWDGGRFRPVNDDTAHQSEAIEQPPGLGHNNGPPLEDPPEIPPEPPANPKARNALLRKLAQWLQRVGPLVVKNARVRGLIKAFREIMWIAEQWDKLQAHMYPPRDLKDLQDAVDKPTPGTEVHHIVETQYNSNASDANSKRFGDGRLGSRENKVRIPYWKHRDVSDWYSRPNEEFGWRTPREYMRGKAGTNNTRSA